MSPSRSRAAWLVVAICAVDVIALLAVPMYVIRPFVPQSPGALSFALTVRSIAPAMSGVCALLALFVVVWAWKTFRFGAKIVVSVLLLVTVAGACLTHVNIFEVMFKPYSSPVFEASNAAKVDADDKVLAVTINGESHAYPVRTMGYHHIVNDVIAGTPVAITYCTLCHTGLVWSRKITGPGLIKWSLLTFRLAGINNGNAVLRDEQTNSIWQQSTGEAIFGPFKGQHLNRVHSDELTFAQWRAEQPNGLVLKPEAQYEKEYDPKDWEAHVERTPTVVDTSRSGIAPHTLMLGVTIGGSSKAYPVKSILSAGLIGDRTGGQSLVVVVGPDQASIRVFKAQLTGEDEPLTFVRSANAVMTDAESGSRWDFRGCAVAGKYAGRCLEPIDSQKDYWFDWVNHNPSTIVFRG
jgi:Protein of unknown function (DUF3179)